MRKKRATDMRGNRKVLMPGPGPAVVEAEYQTRMDIWDKTFARYRSTNCDEKGDQLVSNLSKNQALGLKTLQKKVAKLEVIVLEADKGKKFVIVDEATYKAMAEDHTAGDTPVGREVVRENQQVLSAAAKSMANILKLGSSHSTGGHTQLISTPWWLN